MSYMIKKNNYLCERLKEALYTFVYAPPFVLYYNLI